MNYFFDFDGTLYDSKIGIKKTVEEAAVEIYHKTINFDPIHIGPPVGIIHDQYFPNGALKEDFVKKFRELYDAKNYAIGDYFENVVSTLIELKTRGNSLNILTNKPTLPIYNITKNTPLSNIFDIVSCIDDKLIAEPTKELRMKKVIEYYNIPKNNIIYMGDTEEDKKVADFNNLSFLFAEYGYGELNNSNDVRKINNFKEILL